MAAIGLMTGGVHLAQPSAAQRLLVYHMNESFGSVAHDASGFGNDGRLVNVDLGARGYQGSIAYRFGAELGKRSYVVVPTSTSLNPGIEPIAYRVRWRIAATTPIEHDMRLVKRGSAKQSGADVKMELKVDKDRGVVLLQCGFRDLDGTSANLYLAGDWNDSRWHTTTCAKTSDRVEMISDDTVRSKEVALGDMSSDSALYLGIERNGPRRWAEQLKGKIDEVIITKGE